MITRRRRLLLALPVALAACSNGGAAAPTEAPYPRRACTSYLFLQGAGGGAAIGSWDGWALPGRPMAPHPTRPGWWALGLDLPPGEYGYLLQEGGASRLDEANPLTTFRGSDEVSLLRVDDCAAPGLAIDSARGEGGRVRVAGRFTAAATGGPLASVTAECEGKALTVTSLDAATGAFTVEAEGFERGRHEVQIKASDGQGREASARVGAWVDPRAARWDEGLIYQVVLDRFRGPGGAALAPPSAPGNRAGGTLDGLLSELQRGTFEALGVSALWLSPVYLNPPGQFIGRDGRMYEGYHGYWPVDSRKVDPVLGGEQALRAVIDEAHRRGLRVLLDVVPNHVHEQNPLYQQRRGQGWFNEQGACVCGVGDCDWGKHIQSCWFTPYLPDVRWQSAEAARVQVDDVRWWVDTFGVDGVRVDAVPMMPRAATRRVARALREAAAADEPPFVLGEVFTGPGTAGIEQIRYFLGPHTLDSAFDFPLMWAMRQGIGADGGLDEIESIRLATDEALEGSGAVKARIIGNHDVSRFLSVAAGDDGNDPWTAPPPRPSDPRAFARHRMALALMLSLPGMPVLYYGDELGLPGASDPDCRRVMPSLDALPPEETETLRVARALGSLRACSPALRTGAHTTLQVSRDSYAFRRGEGDAAVLFFMAKGEGPTTFTLPPGSFRDVLATQTQELSGQLAVEPFSVRVLVAAGNPCR